VLTIRIKKSLILRLNNNSSGNPNQRHSGECRNPVRFKRKA
jgi:hypothetical protein